MMVVGKRFHWRMSSRWRSGVREADRVQILKGVKGGEQVIVVRRSGPGGQGQGAGAASGQREEEEERRAMNGVERQSSRNTGLRAIRKADHLRHPRADRLRRCIWRSRFRSRFFRRPIFRASWSASTTA